MAKLIIIGAIGYMMALVPTSSVVIQVDDLDKISPLVEHHVVSFCPVLDYNAILPEEIRIDKTVNDFQNKNEFPAPAPAVERRYSAYRPRQGLT